MGRRHDKSAAGLHSVALMFPIGGWGSSWRSFLGLTSRALVAMFMLAGLGQQLFAANTTGSVVKANGLEDIPVFEDHKK